ncbi:MAG: prepilin peptidase, partial [Myxococcota bacterium]|nr:prepilin peptidase [Myxococcota bacterium]
MIEGLGASFIYGSALAFGLVVGSFLNVVAHRLPLGESVVSPRSRCPGCDSPIAAWDNLPLLSYLLLAGRCRNCGQHISLRYPAV